MAVSDDIKIAVYNAALYHLGEQRLSSLTEGREARRVLDDIWGPNGEIVASALAVAEWNFAARSVKMTPETDVETEFGFENAYALPIDYVRLMAISASDRFDQPLTAHQYVEEGGYWLSSVDPLFVRYVSKDDSRGMDSGKWTEVFRDYLSALIAHRACERLTKDVNLQLKVDARMNEYEARAISTNNMSNGVKFPPRGSWVSGRRLGYERYTR